MKRISTISEGEINVTANKSKKTFTIRTSAGKYRTYPFTAEDFEDAMYWLNNNWKIFMIAHKIDYYLVKKNNNNNN